MLVGTLTAYDLLLQFIPRLTSDCFALPLYNNTMRQRSFNDAWIPWNIASEEPFVPMVSFIAALAGFRGYLAGWIPVLDCVWPTTFFVSMVRIAAVDATMLVLAAGFFAFVAIEHQETSGATALAGTCIALTCRLSTAGLISLIVDTLPHSPPASRVSTETPHRRARCVADASHEEAVRPNRLRS